jgi:hypothetical protein
LSFSDDLALASARLAALAPYLTQAPTSVMMNLLQAHLSSLSDTQTAITNSAANITYTTASGAALVAKAADYNVTPSAGTAAISDVVFTVQAPPVTSLPIPAGTIVSTAGDGTTAPQINFSTMVDSAIDAGQTIAGASIGPVVAGSGTSVAAGLVVGTSTLQVPPTLSGATWLIVATGTGGYDLSTATPGGPPTPVASLATGTTYDDATLIPGVAFSVAGPLTSGESASFSTGGAPVSCQCTQAGVIGNVLAATSPTTGICLVSLGQAPGLAVSNALVVAGTDNPGGAGTGGVDPDTDAQIRNKVAVRATPLYGVRNAQAAILSVAGVYDAYVYDPLGDPAYTSGFAGYIYYAWCDATGAAPAIIGGSVHTGPENTAPVYLTYTSLSGLAAQVDAQIRAYLPAGLVPRLLGNGGVSSPFLVSTVSAASVVYSAPPNVQPSVVDPIIKAAIVAYLNGGTVSGITFPGLAHNEVPTSYGLHQAIAQATGYAVTNVSTLTLTCTTGGLDGTPAPTLIYRSAPNITITVTP